MSDDKEGDISSPNIGSSRPRRKYSPTNSNRANTSAARASRG